MQSQGTAHPGTQDAPGRAMAFAAAREARRRQEVATWPVSIVGVVVLAPAGSCLLLWPDRLDVALIVGTVALALNAAVGVAWPRIARRLGRGGRGYSLQSTSAVPRSRPSLTRRLGLMAVPFVIMGLMTWHVVSGTRGLSLICAYLAAFGAWRAVDLRLWEWGVVAAVAAAVSPVVWMHQPGDLRAFGIAILAMSASLVFVTLGFRSRWKGLGAMTLPDAHEGVEEPRP